MNKKVYYLVACLLLIFSNTQAQQWLKLLPKNKTRQELTLKDHKKAFDAYWKPFNVQNGYYYEDGVKKKAYGWKQFMRWHYEMESQVDPTTGAFPKQTAYEVYEQFQKQHQDLRSEVYQGAWKCLGTDTSRGGYAGIGRINTVAFHPTDINTYWVGTPGGGLWVTKNNGDTWTCLTENTPVISFSEIIIPSDYETSQTIYLGTGDRDSWRNRGIGVLKSTDGGASWNLTGLQFTLSQNIKTNRLLLNPNDNQTIIAATSDGVYKTTNGADDWTLLSNHSFIDMEYKPGDFSTLYGSTTSGLIYTSTDGGANWTEVHNTGERIELAVTPANPNLVVAVAANSDGGLQGIYKSSNSGSSFTLLFNSKNLLDWDSEPYGNGGQGWYDLALAISPTDENVMFVGGINTWKTNDGGNTWNLSNHWYQPPAVHADKHCLKYRDNGYLYECNDGGIYLSTTDGMFWKDKTNGLTISQIYKLSVSATDRTQTIIGLQDNGTKELQNNNWRDVKGGDGMECIIDYTNSDIQYATTPRGVIVRTTNNWADEINVKPPLSTSGAWVTPYVISPSDPNTLYAGYSDIWKTSNRGNSWTKISDIASDDKIRTLAIAPSNENVLYAADLSSIWKTTDGGANWAELNVPWNNIAEISYITMKDDDENHVWVSLTGYNSYGVFETTDGGSSWTNISEGLPQVPIHCVIQDTLSNNEIQLYAGTQLGVYFKKGDNNWVEYNNGLPKVRCGELEIYYGNSEDEARLRLASYGRGLWEVPLASNNRPIINTIKVESSDFTSATAEAEVTDNGGETITARGFVYGNTPKPTLSDNVVTDNNTGLGTFSLELNNLSLASTYYIRAYATNANGTAYGNTIVYKTSCEPINAFPYKEGFEGEAFPPTCWTSFRGANGLGKEHDWETNNSAYKGNYSAYAQYENVTNGEAEDWLVMPAMTLPSDSVSLSFYEKKEVSDVYQSKYSVRISTTSQYKINSFSSLINYTEHNLSTNFTKRIIDLSAYASQTVCIAFVLTNDNDDSWYIDNVRIGNPKSDVETLFDSENIKLYPNPTQNDVKVDLGNSYKNVTSISIINNLGKEVLSTSTIDQSIVNLSTESLPSGIYFVNILKNNQKIVLKLVVQKF